MIAEMSLIVVTSLATEVTLETAYINENIGKIDSKKGTFWSAGSSPVTEEKSANNAAYMNGKVKTKQSNAGNEYREYQCTALRQRLLPPMAEVCLHVQSSAQRLQLITSREHLARSCQAFVV